MFNENSETAQEITGYFEEVLKFMASSWKIKFKRPNHDVARRFLNEIIEFEPADKVRRSSLKPWAVE